MSARPMLLLAVLLLAAQRAGAISVPSNPADTDTINDLLRRANEIQSTLKDNQGNDISIDWKEQDLKSLNGIDPSANRTAIKILTQEINDSKRDRNKLMREAILRTLIAYDIVPGRGKLRPIMPNGTLVYPTFAVDRRVRWLISYGDADVRSTYDNNGDRQHFPPKDNSDPTAAAAPGGAATGPDGITAVFWEIPVGRSVGSDSLS